MKPVIVLAGNDGKIEMTKEQLEKIVTDVYEQGRADAPKQYPYLPYSGGTYPRITYTGAQG
jgi:hypothetical protein